MVDQVPREAGEDDGSKTIVFRKPIFLGKVEYTSITLREPTAGELEIASRAVTSMGVAIELVRIVGKVPRKVVEQIPRHEMRECSDFLGSDDAAPGSDPTEESEPQ